MTHARPARRRLVAIGLTTAVLLLLAISFASIGRTSGYMLFRSGVAQRAGPGVTVAYDAVTDPLERIRIVLHAAPRGGEARPVPVRGDAAAYEMVPTAKDTAKSVALAAQAALFAAFGLIVLWWGKDRASLWLGVCCASLAPELVTLYGFVPEALMLICRVAADVLTFVAFYALYAMADVVADDALRRDDPARLLLLPTRCIVLCVIAVAAPADLAGLLLPVLRGVAAPAALLRAGGLATTICWSVIFCLLPLALLAVAALRASSDVERKRARIILATTVAGLSGVGFSIARELSSGAAPHFEALWFTLLLIPIGFIVVIRAFGVIDIQVIVSRILVISVMTLIIGLAITMTEMIVHSAVDESLKGGDEGQKRAFDAVLQFLVGFVIVLIFAGLHSRVDKVLERLVFRRRDRGIAALREFGEKRVLTIGDTAGLWERTAAVVCDALGTESSAIYETRDRGYVRVRSAGPGPWPSTLALADPRFDPKHAAEERVYLFHVRAGGTALGAIAVAARTTAVDPTFDPEELEALEELARAVAEIALAIRLRALAGFIGEIADGRVSIASARERATVLRDDVPDIVLAGGE